MGSGRWPKVRTEAFRRSVRLLIALVLAFGSREAAADVLIAPSHDGYLGAWLAAGPIPEAAGKQLDPKSASPRLGTASGAGPAWRVVSAADGAIDLAKQLRAGKRGGPFALLGAELELAQAFDGYLLLSVDGGASVVLDSSELWSRDTQRLRGASWDVIPLQAAAGRHRLVFKLHHRGDHWAVMVRLLDRSELVPPRGALVLPGAAERDGAKLAASMLSVSLESGLSAAGYRPRIGLEYRRGMPLGASRAAQVTAHAGARRLFAVRVGEIPVGPRGVFPFGAQLPLIEARAIEPSGQVARLRVTAEVGPAKLERPLVLAKAAPEAFRRARALEARLERDFGALSDPGLTHTSLIWQRERLERIGVDKTAAEGIVLRATRRVLDLVDTIERGEDPLLKPGIQSVAHRSRVDGTLQSFRIHVPAGFQPGSARNYPLVVLLHGWGGRPSSVLKAFIDRKRGKTPHPAIDGFLVAPAAHDNSFYRTTGEQEVLRVIDWMLDEYPIDRRRVSITGVSMGGTGTAHLALRYADRFSAAAPLCGYHSYFVRRDTSGKPLRDWEKSLMHHWSPASFAENGRNLPLFVAHGTKDYPLENSRVLVRRYRQLGYSIKDEWPDTGHAVWERIYANAALWPWLSRAVRPAEPAHVQLKADALRYGSQYWVHLTQLERRGQSGEIEARVLSPQALALETTGVLGWRLDRPGVLSKTEPVTVTVDGQALSYAPGSTLEARREAGVWRAGAAPPSAKRAGLEGPIHDAFFGPLQFVYGSEDPATLRANREVADAFAHARDYARVRYPVIPDHALDPRSAAEHHLFLVGTTRDNGVLRRLAARLPLGLDAGGVRVGEARFNGKELGVLFIHPNPEHPGRYVVVLSAADVAGLYRALSLPKLLPDWVVYDEGVADASAQQVLGHARVLSAGFFDAAWRLPAPAAANPAPAASGP